MVTGNVTLADELLAARRLERECRAQAQPTCTAVVNVQLSAADSGGASGGDSVANVASDPFSRHHLFVHTNICSWLSIDVILASMFTPLVRLRLFKSGTEAASTRSELTNSNPTKDQRSIPYFFSYRCTPHSLYPSYALTN